MTLAEFLALSVAGMPVYDSLCHAMTTLAAGGFSPHALSIAGYDNAAVEWIICLFMFLAGANFALQYRALLGRPGVLVRDEEFRVYTTIVLVSAVCLTGFLWRAGSETTLALRHGLFQTLSILTTTGYASVDFQLWGDQAKMILLTLMFIGGCAGSAAGGTKVIRHVLIGRYTLTELRRTLHPRGVLPVKVGGKVVSDDVMRTVLVFFLFYILMTALCVIAIVLLGADLITGITATMATLGNVGPGPRWSWAGRADGQLRAPAPAEQAGADRRDVDRSARDPDRPRAAATRGLAVGALAAGGARMMAVVRGLEAGKALQLSSAFRLLPSDF